ncbi:DUF169 domain-containing protein [Deferribacter thermophilus]|uniref:DUF169 domain-containing protein n=1 Tax=Deferribacter thermophilus TaxID=53573 RepID=UPI003C236648
MKSKIAEAIKMDYNPVALIWSDEKPENAIQFQKGKWGCIMWLATSAAKGKTAVCDRETFGCWGGGVGVGFGNQYENFPGGEECFCRFLSSGNKNYAKGEAVANDMKPYIREEFYNDFLYGERYLKTPELVKDFIKDLPIIDIPAKYVVFKPLKDVDIENESPEIVIFFVNPDQLSALVILANYYRKGNENVIIPYAAGCQALGIYPYKEAKSENPRAVIGMTDISARLYTRNQLGENIMSFALPYRMFKEMEENVENSFLYRDTWKSLIDEK